MSAHVFRVAARPRCLRRAIPFALAGLLATHAALAQCVQGDCVDGRGEWRYDDGSRYVGEWRRGKRHGQGRLLKVDGGIQEGEWRDGFPEGRGQLTFPDGAVREGRWKAGQFVAD